MVELLVTYMEMTAPPAGDPLPPPVLGAAVVRAFMQAEAYLALYRRVGEAVQWDGRLRMHADDLRRWLADESNHVHVLRVGGDAAGLCEFEGVGREEVELAHFGLDPAFQGRGLGSYLLDHCLRRCWGFAPRRIWLHTDTNDHPRAAAVYAKAGFVPYCRRLEHFDD